VQLVALSDPDLVDENETVPAGVIAVPKLEASVAVAVHVEGWPIFGRQEKRSQQHHCYGSRLLDPLPSRTCEKQLILATRNSQLEEINEW